MFEALAFKLEMLWAMIDTIHNAYREELSVTLSPDSVPALWRLARLDYDPARQRPVLLYPEGAVLLNDTGRAILELVDGTPHAWPRSPAELSARYQTDVTADVTEYLSHLAERELIQ